MWRARRRLRWLVAPLGVALVGCQQQMAHQPKYRPLASSDFFSNEQAARPLVAGTVPRGEKRPDAYFQMGLVGGKAVDAFPFPITRSVLERGRERFEIYCAPCHDRTGYGNGMIVQRGFTHPPSLHEPRLIQAPAGHFVQVMALGYGTMFSYASRVSAEDRWAVAAYLRALQLSQRASLADAPAAERLRLEGR
ncbi:cytochrome c [bacterium]|nr:cytochrome c [bacterium]